MKTIRGFFLTLMALVLALGSLGALPAAVQAAAPAALPATPCVGAAPVTCEIWAKTGTISLPGAPALPIYGYAAASGAPAGLPGPVLIVTEGDAVEITLHNDLAEATSLSITGLEVEPDLVGVAPGSSKVYSFTAPGPGTYIYEAGVFPGGFRQVALGLYGVLVVRPAGQPTWAYGSAATAFDNETLLVFSSIDPALNNNPAGFSIQNYAPKYFLINGKVYPDTDEILTSPGERVLLRVVNAGINFQSFGVLGMHQSILGQDANPAPFIYQAGVESVAPGQTLDALVTIPASAQSGFKYAIYDSTMKLRNSAQPGLGGALAFLTIPGGLPAFPAGPLANNVTVSPSPTNGALGVTLTAVLSDVTTGNQNVVAGEYFIDVLGAPGSGTPLSGTFGTPTVADASAFIDALTLGTLSGGQHILYVRGRDSGNNWGAVNSAVLWLDRNGPASKSLTLSPNPTNGTQNVSLGAIADDTLTGQSTIAAAEYFIGALGAEGAGIPMQVSSTTEIITSVSATISSATLFSAPEGEHTIWVRSQDSLGNWGVAAAVVLRLDKTGPNASGVTLTPASLDLTGAPPVTSVRLDVLLTDPLAGGVQSNLNKAEAFLNLFTGDNTGISMFPTDGQFNSPVEAAYFNLPIGQFYALPQGLNTVFVHGRDAAGNWGPLGSTTILVDKGIVDTEGPIITGLYLTPNPTGGALEVQLFASAGDPNNYSNIAAMEWFVGADPGVGLASPMQTTDGLGFNKRTFEQATAEIDVNGWAEGAYVVSVRALDGSGNWGPVATITLNVTLTPKFYLPFVINNP